MRPLGGYLKADAARTAALRNRFSPRAISGSSDSPGTAPMPLRENAAASPAELLAPFLELPGWGVVDLQYGNRAEDRAALKRLTGRDMLHEPSDDAMQDLDGWAAEIASVDVVVSIDNSVVHLAAGIAQTSPATAADRAGLALV